MTKYAIALLVSVSSVACFSLTTDVRGDYKAFLVRSASYSCPKLTPTPTGLETTVTITDPAEDISIQGSFPCTVTWTATDYGPVGHLDGIANGCAMQPAGFTFAGGSFGARAFTMSWKSIDNEKCIIEDQWDLVKK